MVVYRLFNVIVPFTGLVKVAVIVFPLNVPEKLSVKDWPAQELPP